MKSCRTCIQKGNAEEMVAGRFLILCGVTGKMISPEKAETCIAYEVEGNE